MPEEQNLELKSDVPSRGAYWRMQVSAAKDDVKDWWKRSRSVIERYEDDRGSISSDRRFNILWSNTKTLESALFSRYGKPDIRRRHGIADPVGRDTAMVLERTTEFYNDLHDPSPAVESAVLDMLLTGMGVCRLDYEAAVVTTEEPVTTPEGFPVMDEMGAPVSRPVERIVGQELAVSYVYYEDFLHEPARKWKDVSWCAFKHLFGREELEARFGEAGAEVNLTEITGTVDESTSGSDDREVPSVFKRAVVWEIWDKSERKRLWFCETGGKILLEEPDPLSLEGFFPCPEPVFGPVITNTTLIPTPEFCVYQDQADELDKMTLRIVRLVDALRRRGVYDSQFKEQLGKLASAGDNEFIPLDAYQSLAAAGGLKGVFSSEDIAVPSQVVSVLYSQRQSLIQQIYEITGISDVLRGSTDPRETATAQKIKGQFGSLRLKSRQAAVTRFLRELMRMQVEIIAEHFEPDILSQAAGMPVTPEMLNIMRQDKLRGFVIDVETDSTAFEDANAEKSARLELISAVTTFGEKWLPAIQQMPVLAPLAMELLSFGVRSFKAGAALDDVITRTMAAIAQQAQMQAQMAQMAQAIQAPPMPGMPAPAGGVAAPSSPPLAASALPPSMPNVGV